MTGKKKKRLDAILMEKGLFESREKARGAIMAGNVTVGGRVADKPGQLTDPSLTIEVSRVMPYVSRGGLKLERAITTFSLDFRDKVVLDIGASTGGFTDCALKHGARLVYAVDVGYGQLAWSLRNDHRVVSLERTNIRYISRELIKEPVDIFTVDVSFISLTKIFPVIDDIIPGDWAGVVLIKPQFEAGRDKVGKKGVVRDPEVHKEVILHLCQEAQKLGWTVRDLDFSPIKGPEGNIEYLMHISKSASRGALDIESKTISIVNQAHQTL